MGAHRDVKVIERILCQGRLLPDMADRRDVLDLAGSLTKLSRNEVAALGQWLFFDGPYPGDKVFVRVLHAIGD